MKQIILIYIAALSFTITGCSDNTRAKTYGGSVVIELPKGQKLVTATWKDAGIWYLTRPFRAGEFPEVSTFKEKSTYGMLEGTVTFKEQ